MTQLERRPPLLAPGVGVALVVRPGQVVGELSGHVVQVGHRVPVVPVQHLQGGEGALGGGLGEVGEGDPAVVAVTVAGDEEEVVGSPARSIGGAGLRARLDLHLRQDAAERHDRQLPGCELDEEDAPRLTRDEGPQSLDLLDLGRVLRVDPELVGLVVVRQLLEIGPSDRPVELVAEEGDQLVEAPDAGEALTEVGRWSQASVRKSFRSRTGSMGRGRALRNGLGARPIRFFTARTRSRILSRRFFRISLWRRWYSL